MEPSWAPARRASARTAWLEVLRPLAVALRDEARALSESVAARLSSSIQTVYGDPANAEQARAATEVVLIEIADSIAAGSDPRTIELPPWVLVGTRSRVTSAVPLAPMTRAFWLGREVLWEWAYAEISRRATNRDVLEASAALCSTWIYEAIDAIADAVSELYEVERERWLRTAAAARTETIDAILSERERDTARASVRLRYELGRHHVAFIAWLSQADAAESWDHQERAIAQIGQALGADGSIVEPVGLIACRVWMSRSAPFEESALDVARIGPGMPGQVRIALGEPGVGVAGFRRSYVEATHARRVALLLRARPGTITRFRTVELTALATADIELARLFVERTLGQLALDDDGTRRLAATLGVYLDESASRVRTAKRLGIHSNTVSYRIRQAEELLGHPVEANSTKLNVALTMLPALRGLGDSQGAAGEP